MRVDIFFLDIFCKCESTFVKFPKFQKSWWFCEGILGVKRRGMFGRVTTGPSLLCQLWPAWLYPFSLIKVVALFVRKLLFVETSDAEFIN